MERLKKKDCLLMKEAPWGLLEHDTMGAEPRRLSTEMGCNVVIAGRGGLGGPLLVPQGIGLVVTLFRTAQHALCEIHRLKTIQYIYR